MNDNIFNKTKKDFELFFKDNEASAYKHVEFISYVQTGILNEVESLDYLNSLNREFKLDEYFLKNGNYKRKLNDLYDLVIKPIVKEDSPMNQSLLELSKKIASTTEKKMKSALGKRKKVNLILGISIFFSLPLIAAFSEAENFVMQDFLMSIVSGLVISLILFNLNYKKNLQDDFALFNLSLIISTYTDLVETFNYMSAEIYMNKHKNSKVIKHHSLVIADKVDAFIEQSKSHSLSEENEIFRYLKELSSELREKAEKIDERTLLMKKEDYMEVYVTFTALAKLTNSIEVIFIDLIKKEKEVLEIFNKYNI